MYRFRKTQDCQLTGIESYIGDSIECKVRKILEAKEPIKDGAPLIYTERKEGVLPGYNIRTDRFEVAVDAMDKVTKSKVAKREAKVVPLDAKKDDVKDGGAASIQGTGGEPTK